MCVQSARERCARLGPPPSRPPRAHGPARQTRTACRVGPGHPEPSPTLTTFSHKLTHTDTLLTDLLPRSTYAHPQDTHVPSLLHSHEVTHLEHFLTQCTTSDTNRPLCPHPRSHTLVLPISSYIPTHFIHALSYMLHQSTTLHIPCESSYKPRHINRQRLSLHLITLTVCPLHTLYSLTQPTLVAFLVLPNTFGNSHKCHHFDHTHYINLPQ